MQNDKIQARAQVDAKASAFDSLTRFNNKLL